jgi:predicted TIM-barrel fold metal-dependent hydrolase
MLALAKYPNVAVKLSGAPSYSREPYPYRNIHKYIRLAIRAAELVIRPGGLV